MTNIENSASLVFNYTLSIPEQYFPYIWQYWNNIKTWHEWDDSLEKTISSDNGIELGKIFQVVPKNGPIPVTVCVTSFIDEMHFTTTSSTPIGIFSIGHSLIKKGVNSSEGIIEHTVCIQPKDYDFFKNNIWENLKKNISESIHSLVRTAENEFQK